MTLYNKYYFIRFFRNLAALIIMLSTLSTTYAKRIEQTAWGEEIIDDPLIEALLDTKAMQRIKGVEHLGPQKYFGLADPLSRYEHCVGVWALLRKANCSKEQQAAGLLHDASHTAFSHLADVVFKKEHNATHSYQDDIHLWFLKEMEIDKTVEKFGISLEQLDPDLPEYQALEQPLPTMCADRIHYTIHVGLVVKKLTKEEAKAIVENLQFSENQWFFTSIDLAKKFALVALANIEDAYASSWNTALYHYFAQALHRAFDLNLVSHDDFHFGTDSIILEKLKKAHDPEINIFLEKCASITTSFKEVPTEQADITIKPKFRGIDPLVLHKERYQLLSELDESFKTAFERVKKWCQTGYGIKLIS